MANTKLTSLDFENIKAELKDYLKNNTDFTDYDFEGSALANIVDLLAYNTHYQSFVSNMIANESFLDSSILRDNVVLHAKSLGFVHPVSGKFLNFESKLPVDFKKLLNLLDKLSN